MPSVRKIVRAAPWRSDSWVAYFERNSRSLLPLPWQRGPEWTEAEKAALVASLQDFQLGESSDGRHLQARAEAYAALRGDPAYAEAMAWFIREEQRHAAVLADFLSAARVPLRQRTCLDIVFRWLRRRAGLELFLCVLLTAEMVGKIYYGAVWRASGSALLRAICRQLLRDEMQHLRFHCERLALLRRQRWRCLIGLAFAMQRCFFAGTSLAVWFRHRRAFRAGGLGYFAYRRACRAEWRRIRRQSDPSFYDLARQPARPQCSVTLAS